MDIIRLTATGATTTATANKARRCKASRPIPPQQHNRTRLIISSTQRPALTSTSACMDRMGTSPRPLHNKPSLLLTLLGHSLLDPITDLRPRTIIIIIIPPLPPLSVALVAEMANHNACPPQVSNIIRTMPLGPKPRPVRTCGISSNRWDSGKLRDARWMFGTREKCVGKRPKYTQAHTHTITSRIYLNFNFAS